MSIGADPITAAVVTMSAVRGTPLLGFMVRKESKGHGTNQYIEGPVKPGQSAVIVEDVVTTGGSSLKAIERVEAFGLKVVGVLAIIDRMEGGAAGVRPARLSARQPADDPRFRHRAAGLEREQGRARGALLPFKRVGLRSRPARRESGPPVCRTPSPPALSQRQGVSRLCCDFSAPHFPGLAALV